MISIERIVTGIPGLDIITRGGLPANRSTLITGRSGTGKTTCLLHIICNAARSGRKVLQLAVEERSADVIATADMLGFGASLLVAQRMLQVVDLQRDGDRVVTGDFDVGGLLDRIRAALPEPGIVAIDSLNALFRPRPSPEGLRHNISQLLRELEFRGHTVLLTSEATSDYAAPALLGGEDFLCDAVLVLRNVVDGKRRRRTIEVHKLRRSAHNKGEYPFAIAEAGMHVFPFEPSSPSEGPAPSERFSSGITGLDELTGGGWYRDSIVIARGPTGSGKTTLAGQYASAGVARNERVVYYGFEETKSILLRNFAGIGIDIHEAETSGNLRLICIHPESTSPEDLLVQMRRHLAEYQPSLIVLDSISSIEHSTSEEGFRIFMIGVVALLREAGRSVLMTQAISSQAAASLGSPFLSTVADAILILDYESGAPSLERTIRVLKQRGSSHETHQRRLAIGRDGLEVGRPLVDS